MYARKSIITLSLLLVVTLLMAGCGKNKVEASEAASAPASEPTVAAASPVLGDATKGEAAYQATCIACHGPDAKGVQGLGKSLHPSDSEFISTQSDEELVQFIKTGRQPDDPLNTTGIAMPPKGGNPAISDDDINNIVAWLRTLE